MNRVTVKPLLVDAPDFAVENHGSLFMFQPLNDAARTHLQENVAADAQWFGGALACEPRYAFKLAESLVGAGFKVV